VNTATYEENNMLEPEQLIELLSRTPFRPFELRTADGRGGLVVNHPRQVAWTEDDPNQVTIKLRKATHAYVDLMLVTAAVELDVLPVELVPPHR
jgi:hypothetical protein